MKSFESRLKADKETREQTANSEIHVKLQDRHPRPYDPKVTTPHKTKQKRNIYRQKCNSLQKTKPIQTCRRYRASRHPWRLPFSVTSKKKRTKALRGGEAWLPQPRRWGGGGGDSGGEEPKRKGVRVWRTRMS